MTEGSVSGQVLAFSEPVSFWGGVSYETGDVIEPGHPQFGENVAGRIVALPHGRGSSSSSSVLAELLRVGKGPAAIITEEPDSILLIGCLVAKRLYGAHCPVVVAELPTDGAEVVVTDGEVRSA